MGEPDCSTGAGVKACAKCGAIKPLGEFNRHKLTRDGRRAECKLCHRAYTAAWRAANPERARAAYSAWRAANDDRWRKYYAEWRARNQRRVAMRAAAWYIANRERHRVSPGLACQYTAIRRARKRNAPVVEQISRSKVWERDGGRCHICGRKADPNNWHLEHIVPLSRGGEHSMRNVAVSHPACNLRKGVTGPAQLRLGVDQ